MREKDHADDLGVDGRIKTDRQERMKGVELTDLARNRHKRLTVVKTVMNLPVA